MTALYLVIPCYNEEAVLPETTARLDEKLTALQAAGKISEASRILLVDDGSRDRTWEMIAALSAENPRFGGVKLSRNRGHQNALLAGLTVAAAHCDAAISLDADLQDDINAIDEMVDRFHEGCEVVYGVRSKRETDTFFKRNTAEGFYKVMQWLGVEIVPDHADYRLLGKKALDALLQYDEANLFLRGIVPLLGYPSATVTYERGERFAGESKYPLKKMLAFACDGITSFSIRPIRFLLLGGVGIKLLSVLWLLLLLVRYWMGYPVGALGVILGTLWLIGGMCIAAIGLVGEYVGRVYSETKHRPRFFLEDVRLR